MRFLGCREGGLVALFAIMKKWTPALTLTSVLLFSLPLSASLLIDNFDLGSVDGLAAGLTAADTAGWSDTSWSGDSAVRYLSATSLTFGGLGYADSMVGGLVSADGSSGDDIITRGFETPVSGTVFMSALVRGEFWNASANRSTTRLLINGNPTDAGGMESGGGSGLGSSITTLRVNDVESLATPFDSTPSTILVVMQLETDISGGNDRVSLWTFLEGSDLSGQNLAALGTPVLMSDGTADIWGSELSSIGLALQSPNTETRPVFIDNLRISTGDLTMDEMVQEVLTGVAVPEPAAFAGLAGVLALLLVMRRGR